MREDRFDSIAAFVQAARHSSIHQAGRKLGVSPATIRRRITRLEDRLRTRLLTRTTRRVALTEAGLSYFDRCQHVLEAMEETDLSVPAESGSRLSGRLRITAPGAFGRRHLAPVLTEFAAANPGICLDVRLTDERLDIVERDIDVAIRMANLADSSLVARKIGESKRYICAAPAYFKARKRPVLPADLDNHDGLYFEGYHDGGAWTITSETGEVMVRPLEILRTTDIELVLHFAIAGRGIAILPAFLADRELRDGTLIHLLPGFELPRSGIYAVHVSRRYVPLKTRSFVDFLVKRFGSL